jgi:hypothetical protein
MFSCVPAASSAHAVCGFHSYCEQLQIIHPHCILVSMWRHTINLLIYSTIDGHLDRFQLGVLMNKCFKAYLSLSFAECTYTLLLGINLGVELLGNMVICVYAHHMCWVHFHSHHQCARVPLLHNSHSICFGGYLIYVSERRITELDLKQNTSIIKTGIFL